jgi:Melibiase
MGGPQARVQLTADRLDLEWPALVSCTELTARCWLRDGSVHESASWAAVPAAGVRHRTTCGPLDVEVELQPGDGCVRLCAEAVATADVDVARVAVAVDARGTGDDLAWVLANGYQSWDTSGVLPAAGGMRESWWTIALATAAGAGLAAAATGARSCCTQFTIAGGELAVVWREAEMLEPLPTLFAGPAGTRWRGEPVLLTAGPDVRAGLASLVGGDARPAPAPAPVGWLSWYHLGPWVSSEDVLAHADLLATPPYRELGYRLVQVDDGWQETYGEWRPNTKFPGGLEALSRELTRRGHVPGLWIAPFLVGLAAEVALHAPDDWFIADPVAGGRAIDERHRAFGPMYALDASNPAVRDYLRALFAGFARNGIHYFKIDFLYAGAYAGLGALRAGVQAIREGAGDDASLVASGAPLLPLVGLVDGCRVGPDTATPLTDFETGVSSPTIFGDEVLAVARNFAARSMLHRWFRLDADIALAGGNLTLEQARVLVTVAALSGGPFFAGDDLRVLPPERLALLTNPEVLALVGGEPALPDWEPAANGLPATHWRRGDVLAVFNWAAEPVAVVARAPGAAGARDLWAREDLAAFGDGAHLVVPAQGVRLLRLHPRGGTL